MIGGLQARVAAALLVAAAPLGAQAQTAGGTGATASPGMVGPILLPNRPGTIIYEAAGRTTVAAGGTTVFHGTGPSATITIVGATPEGGNRGAGGTR